MAEPNAVATSEKKEKSSTLDDDLGKEILRSWKLISVTDDTGDFKLEPLGKSKKKEFSFEKMDMDFNLGGGFGKLSSFKNMSDLDFSFPPKKNKKATETTQRDSSRVNFQGKDDRFNFSFDFDKFDIDAAFIKVDTSSSKQTDMKKHATDKTYIEISEVQDNEVTVADILNKPEKGQTSGTVDAMQVQIVADNHDTVMAENHSLRNDTPVDIVLQPDAGTASDKAVHDERENAVDRSCLPVDQPIIQEFNDQSLPASKLGEGSLMEPPAEGVSMDKIVNANVGGEQSICYEAAAEAVSPEFFLPQIAERLEDISNMNKILSDSNGICIEEGGSGSDLGGFQRKTSELSQDDNDVNGIASNTPVGVKESSDGVSDSHNASVASAVKIQQIAMKTLSLLSSRKPMAHKSPPGKKVSELAQLKFVGKSDEANKPNHESPVFSKLTSSNVSATVSDCPPETREAISREKPIRVTAEGGFVSHKKAATGVHTLLRNQRTLITAKENREAIAREKPIRVTAEGGFVSHKKAATREHQHTLLRNQRTLITAKENRKPMADKSSPGKTMSELAQLKFVGKSDEADKPNHEFPVFSKPTSSNVSVTDSDCPPETREAIAREKPIRVTAEGGFVSHKNAASGEHTLLRNQRTLISAKENSLHISHSKSMEMSDKSASQKSEKANVTSIKDCTQSMRHISTAKDKSLPLKSVTRNLGLTDLRSSRTAEKKLQSISATKNDIKSFKDLKPRVVEDVTPKVAVLTLTEKQKPETPTLKRKQAPTGGQVHDTPLKRLSQSLKDSSILNVSDLKIQGQVRDKINKMDINTRSHLVDEPKTPKLDTHGQMNSSVLETPDIGDFGIVEKAAEYGKDLDDLCTMLKKKNEEAKELLVRAVVNSNNLLLLNHPAHEEKIRSVQKLANRLMAREIVPHQG